MTEKAGQRRPEVVVGVDETLAARRALAFAAREATLRNATLVAVMSVDLRDYAWLDPYAVSSHPDADYIAMAEGKLRSILAETDTAAVPVEPLVTTVPASAALIDRSAGADLLVVGSRVRGGFRSMIMGSVSLQCVQHAHCPVTVVPPEPHPVDAAAAVPPKQRTLKDTP